MHGEGGDCVGDDEVDVKLVLGLRDDIDTDRSSSGDVVAAANVDDVDDVDVGDVDVDDVGDVDDVADDDDDDDDDNEGEEEYCLDGGDANCTSSLLLILLLLLLLLLCIGLVIAVIATAVVLFVAIRGANDTVVDVRVDVVHDDRRSTHRTRDEARSIDRTRHAL